LRNPAIPERAEIVTIGDSQTYGVSAMAFNSWPSWLSRMTGQSVYNVALGGWGPIQYEVLLEELAFTLNPKTVVLGLYLGNDVFDAYRVVYGLDHWKSRRLADGATLISPYESVNRARGLSALVRFRAWIGQKSILYRLAVSSAGQLLGRLEIALRSVDPGITIIDDPDLRTAFTPQRRLLGLDRSRPEVQEGLRLTFDALERMIGKTREKGIQLVVLVIPTKEAVFEERLIGRPDLANADAIKVLLGAEAEIREEIKRFVETRGIPFVDPRKAMTSAGDTEPIYPSNEGGHPVSAGYRAIAAAVAEEIAH
jgi:lysophospholipase L1-like esterase